MRARKCIPCVAFVLSLCLAAFSVHAQVQPQGPLGSISSDALLSLVGALLLALLAGYAKGQEKRITAVEIEQRQMQAQMSLFRETVLERHPSRAEMNQLRSDMRAGFDDLKLVIRSHRP